MRIAFEDYSDLSTISGIANQYSNDYLNRFYGLLNSIARDFYPPKLQTYLDKLKALTTVLERLRTRTDPDGPFEVDASFAPYLRHAVTYARLKAARGVERRRAQTTDPHIQAKLDAELEWFARFINAQWFTHAEAIPVPQLMDFFPVELVEAQFDRGEPREREFDEKFHILQAPDLFLHDLARAREAASLRGLLVAAAYLDIDHFKTFNSETSESFVDRNVLPRFMREIER